MSNFILGVIFSICIMPILDGLTALALTFLEMLKSCFAVVMARNNEKIHPEEPQRLIGFSVSNEEEVDEDDL